MKKKIEFYWLHLAATNPSPAFWESLASLENVTVFKETDDDQDAENLLSRVLDTPISPGVGRIAFLHLNDVTDMRGDVPQELIHQAPDRLMVLFTKGDPDYDSDPPVLHYSRDVLPFLESGLLDILRNDSFSNIVETLTRWLKKFRSADGTGTLPRHATTLPEPHQKMITSQIHSALGRVSAALRRIRAMQSEHDADSWSAIIRSLEEAEDFLDSAQEKLHRGHYR